MVTDAVGTMSACPTNSSLITGEDESDYYPYGGEQLLCNRVPQNYKFTGKERDSESGLDNFGARYDTSSLGRFMTPDWAARPTTVPYAVFGDPQSLNLYGYVRNDPVSRADTDGHEDQTCKNGANPCKPEVKVKLVFVVTGAGIRMATSVSTSSTTAVRDSDGNILSSTTTETSALFLAEGTAAGQYMGTVTTKQTVVTALGTFATMKGSPSWKPGLNDSYPRSQRSD
jgi:RHS repeat-associated protein